MIWDLHHVKFEEGSSVPKADAYELKLENVSRVVVSVISMMMQFLSLKEIYKLFLLMNRIITSTIPLVHCGILSVLIFERLIHNTFRFRWSFYQS